MKTIFALLVVGLVAHAIPESSSEQEWWERGGGSNPFEPWYPVPLDEFLWNRNLQRQLGHPALEGEEYPDDLPPGEDLPDNLPGDGVGNGFPNEDQEDPSNWGERFEYF